MTEKKKKKACQKGELQPHTSQGLLLFKCTNDEAVCVGVWVWVSSAILVLVAGWPFAVRRQPGHCPGLKSEALEHSKQQLLLYSDIRYTSYYVRAQHKRGSSGLLFDTNPLLLEK